jgi:putative two-component system response regulator
MNEILNGKVMLIVDDVATIRAIVSDILAPNGVRVLEADSGEQALRIAGDRPIDAFLLDVRLAGMNGLELCRALRSMDRYRNAPVVFVTALDEREILQWALEAGSDDFIQKPIYPMVLRKRLANLLELAACRHQLAGETLRV